MATAKDFHNGVKQNWCPGCGDFAVQTAIERAVANVGVEPESLAVISGIGCSSRLSGYIYSYGMNSIHGRALPIAQGVKLSNPELTVLAVGGDGDGYAIGLNHTMQAMRRNIDLTYIVMDNHVYGLTKGQTSPRSDLGFKTKTTPNGSVEPPLQIIEAAVAAGASFVAQGFSGELNELTELIELGIRHRGFSLINIFSPCVTFNKVNTYEWCREHLIKLDGLEAYDAHDKGTALSMASQYHGLLTGLIYEDTERLPYDKLIQENAPGPLTDKTVSLSTDVFEKLLSEFQ